MARGSAPDPAVGAYIAPPDLLYLDLRGLLLRGMREEKRRGRKRPMGRGRKGEREGEVEGAGVDIALYDPLA